MARPKMMPAPTPLETVVLSSGDARVFVAPERGGMVTRFFASERAVLYLDESTLLDPTKNVRGGNPVLFPSPGKLDGDRWAREGVAGSMGQHGFARNTAWEVAGQASDEVTLRLASTDATRAVYPWDFIATYRYALSSATLRIEQRFENTGAKPMPFGAGFHPYFELPQARKANTERTRIPTKATRAWDNARKQLVDVTGPIDLTAAEVDLHLIDHGSNVATLDLGDGHRVEVRASAQFERWIIWTLAGRDFVCVEPWTSPGNALNTGEGLLVAQPRETVELWTEIALVAS
jgi:galactose mutarotase-like enzyme